MVHDSGSRLFVRVSTVAVAATSAVIVSCGAAGFDAEQVAGCYQLTWASESVDSQFEPPVRVDLTMQPADPSPSPVPGMSGCPDCFVVRDMDRHPEPITDPAFGGTWRLGTADTVELKFGGVFEATSAELRYRDGDLAGKGDWWTDWGADLVFVVRGVPIPCQERA